jgi:hypothetical protein
MARPVLLGTLVTRCQQRATALGDGSIDPPEVKALISEYYGEAHALVTEKGARYFQAEDDITADGSVTYALPDEHMATIGVDLVLSGTTGPRRPVLGPIDPKDRSYLVGLTNGGPAAYFGFEGNALALYPAPTSGTYKHLYVPQPMDLSTAADSTSVDVINVYGERLVLWGVASVILHKGSSAQDRAMAEHDKALGQLEYWACMRAMTQTSYRIPEDQLRCIAARWPR